MIILYNSDLVFCLMFLLFPIFSSYIPKMLLEYKYKGSQNNLLINKTNVPLPVWNIGFISTGILVTFSMTNQSGLNNYAFSWNCFYLTFIIFTKKDFFQLLYILLALSFFLPIISMSRYCFFFLFCNLLFFSVTFIDTFSM